jgi:hypothetical protein
MMDLNSLIPSGSPLYLTFGSGINDQGEISGSTPFSRATPTSNRVSWRFLRQRRKSLAIPPRR